MISRYRNPDVDYVVDKLIEFGVIDEEGCSRLAQIFRDLEAIQGVAPEASLLPSLTRASPLPPTSGGEPSVKMGKKSRLEISPAEVGELYAG